jgi:RNA polymerase sigma factor (sigma-70 family)
MEHRRQEYEYVIDEWVLNERDRIALKRKYLDGIPYEAIAEELDISRKTVQNIVRRWRNTIERHL